MRGLVYRTLALCHSHGLDSLIRIRLGGSRQSQPELLRADLRSSIPRAHPQLGTATSFRATAGDEMLIILCFLTAFSRAGPDSLPPG